MKKGALFTAIAYVGVWLLVGTYWLCGQTTESPLWVVIATLCMTMPLIATIILQRIEKKPVLRGLCIRWKPNRWWFAAWLLPALLTAATVGISCLLPGMHFTTESPLMTESLDKINAALPSGKTISPTIFLLAQVANGFIAGITINALIAFGEEIGWRGYLLKHTDDLLSGPIGLAGIVTSILGLGVLHLTDRRILSSTI